MSVFLKCLNDGAYMPTNGNSDSTSSAVNSTNGDGSNGDMSKFVTIGFRIFRKVRVKLDGKRRVGYRADDGLPRCAHG